MLAFSAEFIAGVILKQFFYKQSRDFLITSGIYGKERDFEKR